MNKFKFIKSSLIPPNFIDLIFRGIIIWLALIHLYLPEWLEGIIWFIYISVVTGLFYLVGTAEFLDIPKNNNKDQV